MTESARVPHPPFQGAESVGFDIGFSTEARRHGGTRPRQQQLFVVLRGCSPCPPCLRAESDADHTPDPSPIFAVPNSQEPGSLSPSTPAPPRTTKKAGLHW